MSVNRRDFLKLAGVTGVSLLAGAPRRSEAAMTSIEFYGLLVDTTKCIGCRSCEEACNEQNGLPKPEVSFSSDSVFEKKRDTSPDALTVLNRYPNAKNPDNPVFVRRQCLHCCQPGCASACLTKAMEKTVEGPVIYHKDRCMGCRYCMVACPHDIPKFEYGSAFPYIRKCIFCYERLKSGERPACVDACPENASIFGTRRELLEIARTRICENPDKYVHHVYGEHEAGGSGTMYLSAVPFEKLGFRTDLGTTPYPEHTSGFLYGVPLVFVLWPSFLIGLNYLAENGNKGKNHEEEE